MASQDPCVTPGTIPLTAGPASGEFELGPAPWVYISGTGGTTTGVQGTVSGGLSSESVVVGSSPGCVLVCCPFTDGTGCDSSFSGYTSWLTNCE
jgi:hypothetical protein